MTRQRLFTQNKVRSLAARGNVTKYVSSRRTAISPKRVIQFLIKDDVLILYCNLRRAFRRERDCTGGMWRAIFFSHRKLRRFRDVDVAKHRNFQHFDRRLKNDYIWAGPKLDLTCSLPKLLLNALVSGFWVSLRALITGKKRWLSLSRKPAARQIAPRSGGWWNPRPQNRT